MPRPKSRTAILAFAGFAFLVFLAGAGLAFVGHIVLANAWSGLGFEPVVFPDSQ